MMKRLFFIFLPIITISFLSGCAGGPGVDAYHRANTAFEQGDYRESFANYLYAAHQGVVPAQYAVGYQYYYGLGTKRDEVKGIVWLEHAAYHSPRARYALHLITQKTPKTPWTYQLKN